MHSKTRKITDLATEAGYNRLDELQELPKQLTQLLIHSNAGKYGYYLKDLVFYKGDPETTKDWVIVFDDGGFYKVDAQDIIWTYDSKDDVLVARARWSKESLFNGLCEFFQTGQISVDPEYQT